MSENRREENQHSDSDVEEIPREFPPNPRRLNSNVSSFIEYTSPNTSTPVHQNRYVWPYLIFGFKSGVVCTLAFQNCEEHRVGKLAFTCAIILCSYFLMDKFFKWIGSPRDLRTTEESRHLEHQQQICMHPYYRMEYPPLDRLEVVERFLQLRNLRMILPPPSTTDQSESFPPSPAVSDVSSDVLAVERVDYRPNSTDLSFRQRQQDRARKYKMLVEKRWISAPSGMVVWEAESSSEDDENDLSVLEVNVDD